MGNSNTLMKSEQASFSLRDVASIWFRHKLLIVVTFLAIAVGTGVVTMLMPNEYESRMKILVKSIRTDVPITPERTNGAAGAASDNSVTETQINSEIELLTSKDLLNEVAKGAGLDRHSPSLMERVGLKEKAETDAARIEVAAERLSKDLVITPVKKTNIVEVTYSSSSPSVAANVLQKLQTLYLEKHLKLRRLPETYEFFKAQADQYEQQLRAAEAELSNFQRSMNVVSLTQQKDLTVQKMADARSKLMETQSLLNEVNERIVVLQDQMRTLQPRIVTQTRALPNQYSAERLNTMLVELKNRRTQLLSKFRAEDRLVREVDKQIETTKAALERASGQTATEQATDLNPLRQTLEAELARARIDRAGNQAKASSLEGQVQDYDNQLSRLESITGQYQDLTRRVKEAEDNYQLYEKKREEARIADELDQSKITNVSIAEVPVASQLPVRPNRPLNLVLGLFLAVVVSIGSVVAAEFMREDVQTPRELEALTGTMVLATVPIDQSSRRSLIIDQRRLALPPAESEVEWASGD
jgi:uncharacterized protein involved in exopolysaccharide biosynthesis